MENDIDILLIISTLQDKYRSRIYIGKDASTIDCKETKEKMRKIFYFFVSFHNNFATCATLLLITKIFRYIEH